MQWAPDGPINSQEYKSFEIYVVTLKISMTEYRHRIKSDFPFILTQQSMGRNESGKSGHLFIFTSLKHLMVLLMCKFFSGLHFYTLLKVLQLTGTCSSDLLK